MSDLVERIKADPYKANTLLIAEIDSLGAALAAAQAGALPKSEQLTEIRVAIADVWSQGPEAIIEAMAPFIDALRPPAEPAESEAFDITDGRHRYRPCPRCGATLNMGLCHRGDMLAVQCGYCQFRGPEVAGRVSEQKDRCAFNAWNALSLAQFTLARPSASEPAGPSETELAQVICEWDSSDKSTSRCHCASFSADDPNRCQSPIGIARVVLAYLALLQDRKK